MYGRGVRRREKQCLTATWWSDAVYGVPEESSRSQPCGPGWSRGRTMRTTLAYEATSSCVTVALM